MAINKKLIHFEKRDNFDTRLANNEINETSIVFIKDTGELWTHGLFFCTTAIPKPHDHDDRYLKLTGGTMTGSINWGTGSTREILLFSTNSTWKSGLRYSWSTNTTVALWGKLLNTQFVWNAGTDEELNGTTTKTYDFLIGRDTSGTYNGKVVGRIAGNIIWHAGNDGSGSGLDADLLDGQHGSYYLKEANLEWGGKNFSGAYGPVDAAMIDELGANRAAFAKAAGIAVEYSRDGGATWTDYGLTDALKIGIFSTSTCIIAGKRTTNDVVGVNDQVRVRLFTSAAGIYTALNKFTIYLSTSGSTGCWCTIKARKQADYENNVETYTTYANNVTVSGWSGWNIINTNSITTYGNAKATLNGELIFIFGVTGYNGNGTTLIGLNISKIRCFGGLGWTTPSNMARDGHLYSYDSLQNATFPAQITATAFKKSGGTSSQFLKADGSVDSNTYITAASVGNGTLSLQASGTTKTSFTANQSGNATFNIATGASNGSISVGGTDVAVKGLGSNGVNKDLYLGVNNLYVNFDAENKTFRRGTATANADITLGSATYPWKALYADTVYENGTSLANTYAPKTHTHPYTDLTGSTTTADLAIVSSGTANGWTLKTLGSHAFDSTDYVTIATDLTITGTKTFNIGKWKLAASESNEIVDKQWGVSTYYKNDDSAVISSLSSITRALRFRWYNDYYDIGVVRGPSQVSAGFGIGIENSDNTHVLDLFRVSATGAYILGNLALHASNYTSYVTSAYVNGLVDGKYVGGYISHIKNGFLVTHPEATYGTIIPFLYNDIAFLIKRGGNVSIYSTTDTDLTLETLTVKKSWGSGNTFDAMFNASPSYYNFGNGNATEMNADGIIIDITLPRLFTFTNRFYIDFGNGSWGYENIDLLLKNSNKQTEYVSKVSGGTTNDSALYFNKISHSVDGTSGFDRMRIHLYGRTATGGVRIAQIGLIEYASAGHRNTTMSLGIDDPIYRSITPASGNTYALGSSSARWSNVYSTLLNISGTLTASSTVILNGLDAGSADVVDGTEFLTSYAAANGFSTSGLVGKVYKRPVSKLYNYLKGKFDALYLGTSGNATTATEFASAQSVTLTGDTTGTASSKAGWSIATTTNRLSGYSGGGINATIAITGAVSAGKINYYYGVKGGTSGLFTTSSDANAIIRISRNSSENYDSLLGLSSNGNLYYRYFNNAAPDTTTTWKQIAFTDSNITGLASYAANVGSAGTLGTNYVAASKVIAACNWYDTVTGSDTDSVINRWDEIVNFVAGFEETPDLATYLANNYLAKTGNSTASPMTGTIYSKDVNALVINSTNNDLDIWRVMGNAGAWDSSYGFYLRYNGTGLGNNNSLSLWANNQTGNDVEVYQVKLDGILNFLTAPTINGTAISLTTHDHDDRYLKLIGGTLTGTLNLDSATMGTVAHLTFNREWSYLLNKASRGKFCFLANNAAAGSSANSDLTIADGAVYPGTSGHTALGTSTLKFSQLHLSGAANIGGTLTAASSLYLTGLTEGTSDVTDDTELVTSYAGESGFANATGAGLAYRRKASKLYNYIKTKTDNLYSSNEDSIEYIVGTLTASTNAWLGVTKDSSLRVGKMIAYKLPFAGTGSAATLNLTLSGGGTTGAITLRRKNGNVTTHYSATEVIFMVYDGTYWQVNSYYDSDSNGYYHRRIYPNLKAGPNKIFPYTMIMLLPDGRWESIVTSSSTGTSKTRNTHGFLLGHVLLMLANATYNENGNVGTYNIFSAHSGLIDHRYSFNTANDTTNGTTGYKPVYIVGTIGNDGLFYLAETWWTQTLPTEEDGKVYIYVGDAYDTYRLTFTEDKPIYIYRNGGIRLYSGTSDNVSWSNITNKPESFTPASHNHDSLYVTSVGVTDDTTNHANLLRYVKNGTSTYFTVPYAEVAGKTGAYLTNKYNTLSAAKGREITVNGLSSVIISGCNLNSGGRFLIWFAGYGPTSIRCTYRILEPGSIKVEYTENASIIIYNTSASEMRFTVTGLLGSFTIGDEVDVPASYSTLSIALYSNTWSSYIGTSSNKVSYAINADIASNLNKSTLGYLYQSATTTTGSTGTVTATSGKIGVPIQFYGSQVNYALNNDLFYATVASNAITANTIYLGDDLKSKTFVKTSTHVPTGASSGSSSSSGNPGESITYTAGNGIKIAGTLISTNTWTGTESLFAELANPSSYDLIYIIED